MFREHCVANAGATKPDVKEIDRKLRDLAQQHAALDADEAHWLRVADAQNAWPALGYVRGLEYLEDVFGYAPRTAMERLRVARELGALPQLEDALRVGELSYSAVRELTRVATPETVDRWINQARGRRFRDVEQMVSGRRKGDEPETPPDPALVRHRLVLELDGESLAVWRQMRQVLELELEQELDRSIDDRSLVLMLGERVLREGAAHDTNAHTRPNRATDGAKNENVVANAGGTKGSKPPPYMIHLMTCRDCGQVFQDGGGVRFNVDRSVLERAQCNAIICDDEHGKRATRTIPAATERLVLERAQHRCQVPGCRSSKHLAIHHIIFRSHGGTHDPSNLIVLCDGHHRLLHDGHLSITGRAPDELVFTRNGQQLLAANQAAAIGAEMRSAAPHRNAKQAHAVRRHATATSKQSPGAARALAPTFGAGKDARVLGKGARVRDEDAPVLDEDARVLGKGARVRGKDAPVLDEDIASLAYAALCQLGFKAAIASRAVEHARARVRADAELADLIKESLRHCS